MYGLPIDFSASVFVGKRLALICYSINTINFSFEEDLSITLMGSFIYRHTGDSASIKQSLPVLSSDMMRLVGEVVCRAENDNDGTLTLHFSNDHVLALLDDSKEYEAYSIQLGNRVIVV